MKNPVTFPRDVSFHDKTDGLLVFIELQEVGDLYKCRRLW